MNRYLASLIAASMLCAAPVLAQHPVPKPTPQSDSTTAQLVGTWEGGVFSDHAPESVLKMVFTRASALKVMVSIVANGQEFVTGEATDLKVDGNSISWNQSLMETSCKATGVLIGGALKGAVDCGHGGVTFLAKKK